TFTVDVTSTEASNLPTTYIWRYIAHGDLILSIVSTLGVSNGLTVTGVNTHTIIITGNTSLIFGYQFYVDMRTGDTDECRKFSNAANYTFDTKAFYRTVASGDWSNTGTWEMSDTEGGTYEPVCQYPIDRTSDKITIQDGHNITFDVELTADWIEICETCTLSLDPNMELTMLDGNPGGPDLIVLGTLVDNGNQANGLKFNDNATWELGPEATLIKTSSSFASRYRDAYHNGISNIPSSANWIYRYTNNGTLDFANSATGKPMYYPNLILENTQPGIYASSVNSTNSNLSSFTITGGTLLTIKGNFEVGHVGNIRFSNVNTHTEPVLVMGDLMVNAGSKLLNGGGIESDYVTGFEVRTDLNIEGTLDLSAGTDPTTSILILWGAEDMNGVGAGTVLANHIIIDKDPGADLLS